MTNVPQTAARPRWDALSLSVEAVAAGAGTQHDWETLAAFCQRDGVDCVAAALANKAGGDLRRWRGQLLLGMDLSCDALLALTQELAVHAADGGGLASRAQTRHARSSRPPPGAAVD
ncbi:MAG TPA: hypothetical protein VF331_22835 [Polyangiales bacterium]